MKGERPARWCFKGAEPLEAAPVLNPCGVQPSTRRVKPQALGETIMRIGFIGLGNMGGPMALNLIKAGHTLVVHDIRKNMA